ncbi:hypothetical protein EDB81DRAFT_226398 [Dactylonectria macrodidyma]|uniref:Macro domain-like protein n=1 Tax=Dactylonectria macrodidyma TaxID=307937 RepID=A0A9P9IJS9_9HYPO|nr:hypothetical protein EDB81DRAFT_226398 [Dactylonectria macrodidyma]
MPSYAVSRLPRFHLLCMEDHFIDAFEEARRSQLPSSIRVQIHNCALSQIPSSVQFDTIVSPANSYGRLDGAFDDAISRTLSPVDDYLALTRTVQKQLYEEHRGFAPPGTCTLVHIPNEFHSRSRNIWGTKRIAICPTMRVPDNVQWDREVVYECVWSLLCAVDKHNRLLDLGHPREQAFKINNILMTPIATGVGRVSPKRWAEQVVLALKHFVEALDNPDKWSALEWHDFMKHADEVKLTWKN